MSRMRLRVGDLPVLRKHTETRSQVCVILLPLPDVQEFFFFFFFKLNLISFQSLSLCH